jgi:hypothetical protein
MKNLHKISFIVFSAAILISAGLKQENLSSKKSLNIVVIDSTVKIDKATGLNIDKGLDLVTAHCTGCHSSKTDYTIPHRPCGLARKNKMDAAKTKTLGIGRCRTCNS